MESQHQKIDTKQHEIPFSVIAKMPMMHFFASTACNLNCFYCSQQDYRHKKVMKDAFADPDLLKMIESWPATHFYISGGEPFIHKGLFPFLKKAEQCKHVVSFDTNGVVALKDIEALVNEFPPNFFGVFNITHHLHSSVSLDYILERSEMIQKYGLRQFVKYIAIPDDLDVIQSNMERLKKKRIGTAVTIFQTFKNDFKGRYFPEDYSDKELLQVLGLVTLKCHGLQFFGGIQSFGKKCRGGGDFGCFNMHDDYRLTSCCHSDTSLFWQDTVWGGSLAVTKKCSVSNCIGDIMFIFGIQGILSEVERLEKLCSGSVTFLGIDSILNYCNDLHKNVPLVNPYLLSHMLELRSRGRKQQSIANHRKNVENQQFPMDFFVSQALWNQRNSIVKHGDRLRELIYLTNSKNDLSTYQWGQLFTITLEFQPDVIIEVGRGHGCSTTLFTEAANLLQEHGTQVVSICPSQMWARYTSSRINEKSHKHWSVPLQILTTSLDKVDVQEITKHASRVLVFWRDSQPETTRSILTRLLPEICTKPHMVIVHGITDTRYQGGEQKTGYRLWEQGISGWRLRLGDIDCDQNHIIPLVDFAARNRISLKSAEHDLRCGLAKKNEMVEWFQANWGQTSFFSLQAHWYWFSLNEKNGPYCFPR